MSTDIFGVTFDSPQPQINGLALLMGCMSELETNRLWCDEFMENHGYGYSYRKEPLWCIPPAMTISEFREVILGWLKENFDKTYLSAHLLVHLAVRESFPCSKIHGATSSSSATP